MSTARNRDEAESAARQKFLQELRRFASDEDDDEDNEGAPALGGRPRLETVKAAEDVSLFDEQEERGSAAAPVRPQGVGMALLQAMHSNRKTKDEMTVVRTYAPLSTGGFLTATSETDDFKNAKEGDVVVLLDTKAAPPPQQQQQQESEQAKSAVKDGGSLIASRFQRESSLPDDVKQYGKAIGVDMLAQLLEVTRVDHQRRTMEALGLDGKRQVLRFDLVRPAGYVERELYHKWKADPSARPVPTVSCGSTTATSGAAAAATGSAPAPVPWWVLPGLVVRVVSETAGEWLGRKGTVVKVVDRAGEKVRLRDAGGAVVEVVGLSALETVLPKKGERGIVVLGPHKGELVDVCRRLRGPEGDFTQVEVKCVRNQEVWLLEPHEICMLTQ